MICKISHVGSGFFCPQEMAQTGAIWPEKNRPKTLFHILGELAVIPSEVSYSSSMDGGSPMTNVEMIWVRFETGDQQGCRN